MQHRKFIFFFKESNSNFWPQFHTLLKVSFLINLCWKVQKCVCNIILQYFGNRVTFHFHFSTCETVVFISFCRTTFLEFPECIYFFFYSELCWKNAFFLEILTIASLLLHFLNQNILLVRKYLVVHTGCVIKFSFWFFFKQPPNNLIGWGHFTLGGMLVLLLQFLDNCLIKINFFLAEI